MTPQELSERLWLFAARIAKVVDALPEPALADTSPGRSSGAGSGGPNYDEARSGESRADFVHKVNIALKEFVQTRGWLKFIILAKLLPGQAGRRVAAGRRQKLFRILGKSVATAKAARTSGPVEEKDQRLAITNNKFSMTNSQSRSPQILSYCFDHQDLPPKVKCTRPQSSTPKLKSVPGCDIGPFCVIGENVVPGEELPAAFARCY